MKVFGIINLINDKSFLKELTANRCLASVPFAGRYRLIDFTLSNYMHAGIKQVAVFTNSKFRSILDHLGSGKEWDLDRCHGGLFVLPPAQPDEQACGDISAFYEYLDVLRRSSAETVVISPGYHVGKVDYQDVIREHERSKADITVLYKKYNGSQLKKPIYHKCILQETGRLMNMELYTAPKEGDPICLETYIMKKSLFMSLVESCFRNQEYDFLKDAIKTNLDSLLVKGYSFRGYMPFIHSIESYYESNMEFLKPEVIRSHYYDQWEIFTKVKHEAPAKYGVTSSVSNAFIANGCDIQGTVENSILFRGVKIKKGAVVKNSIIMQKGEIEEDVYLDHVISDKQAVFREKSVLIGEQQPKIIKKSEVI